MTRDLDPTAQQLKQLLLEMSPIIEEYTAAVCPGCTAVCCRQKHGMYSEHDRIYLAGLGAAVPGREPGRDPDGPCQMMGQRGCMLPRWLRPFRCTWYFCDTLILALQAGPQRTARKLAANMMHAIELYQTLPPGR
ncbi:MAG TPA: hypothetical protein VK654_16090 [Nitrospirota bacterium]|nr:hypothetical protein [Nitrospirota bacterium]